MKIMAGRIVGRKCSRCGFEEHPPFINNSNSKGEIICPLCRTENPWLIIGGCIYEAG